MNPFPAVVCTAAFLALHFTHISFAQEPGWNAAEAEKIFDKVWQAYDEQYAMFAIRPEVDWDALRETYRPLAAEAADVWSLADVLAEMLQELEDWHIWLKVQDIFIPVYQEEIFINANAGAYTTIYPNLQKVSNTVQWAKSENGIGFIAIHAWNDNEVPAQVDRILEELRDTHALIIDVRYNSGGSELLARDVAGRFSEMPSVYAYSRYRSGLKHTDLTDFLPREFSPSGDWTYIHPVVVLIGERCMSSNEAFIAMMDQIPQVTLMGANTRGASGNPTVLELEHGITLSLPRWITYLADQQPLEPNGITPDVVFKPDEDAFSGTNDDLLQAAMARLRVASMTDFEEH